MSPELVEVKEPSHQVQEVRPLQEIQYDMVDQMPNYGGKKEATIYKKLNCTGEKKACLL